MGIKNSFFFTPEELSKTVIKKAARRTPTRGCQDCGLDRLCRSGRMDPAGGGDLGIAVVMGFPGDEEGRIDRPMVGPQGAFLRKHFRKVGISLDDDCLKVHVLQCRTPKDRLPEGEELMCCRSRVTKQLREFKPDLIFAFGTPAISEILRDAPFSANASNMHGRVVPSHLWGCPVVCGFAPSFYLSERQRGEKTGKFDARMTEAMRLGLTALAGPPLVDTRLDPVGFEMVEDLAGVERLLNRLTAEKKPTAFDWETNGLDSFQPDAKLLLASLANVEETAWVIPLEHRQARWSPEDLVQVKEYLKNWLAGPTPKIIQNWQFEEVWSVVKLGTTIKNVVADTMVRAHILDNRSGVTKQEFMEFVRYGESGHKGSVDRAALHHEYLDTVARYGALDVRYDLRIYYDQLAELPMEF